MFGYLNQNNYGKHIYFTRSSERDGNSNENINNFDYYFKSSKNHTKITNSKSLFLLSPSYHFNICKFIPRLFTITTKNGSANFNTYILKDTSTVITEFLDKNPQNLQYHLDIDDHENVLGKFEQMYQGEFVVFDEDELPISNKITKLLNLKCCPNFMKPESLKSVEINKSLYQSSLPILGVQINQNSLNNYLISEAPRTFIINTNKNIYECNVFGIYSSSVIKEVLTENPTIDIFYYNYDDEFNEFQSICDLFNFKEVSITKNNIDLIKKIAEDLKIDIIMKDINGYIETTGVIIYSRWFYHNRSYHTIIKI